MCVCVCGMCMCGVCIVFVCGVCGVCVCVYMYTCGVCVRVHGPHRIISFFSSCLCIAQNAIPQSSLTPFQQMGASLYSYGGYLVVSYFIYRSMTQAAPTRARVSLCTFVVSHWPLLALSPPNRG